jgi:hypothetical protein
MALRPVTTRLAARRIRCSAGHEPEHGQAGEVDLEAVASEGDVVTEPRRHLGCVRHTSHPGERGDVVQGAAVIRRDTDEVAQARRNEPRPQHVLHGLAETEVGGQREGGHELGQPDARVALTGLHGPSVRTSHLFAASCFEFVG